MFASSPFNLNRRALFKPHFWDFTDFSNVTGFCVNGSQPPGTDRRFIFKIDDQLFKFASTGLDTYNFRGELDDILIHGNTADELLNAKFIPFNGKIVQPIIALSASPDAQLPPTVSIAAFALSFNDCFIKNELSPIFDLKQPSKIFNLHYDSSFTGNASINVFARTFLNSWSDWGPLSFSNAFIASKIQFKVNHLLSNLDGSQASKLISLSADFVPVNSNASNSQFFFTKPQSFTDDLHSCRLTISHQPLVNCSILAFASFQKSKSRVSNLQLGTSSGNLQTFALPNKFISPNSIHLSLNQIPTNNFFFDSQFSSISFQAPPNLNISISYEFAEPESWIPLPLISQSPSKSTFAIISNASGNFVKIKFALFSNLCNSQIPIKPFNSIQTFVLPNSFSFTTGSDFFYSQPILKLKSSESSTLAFSSEGVIPIIHAFAAAFSI